MALLVVAATGLEMRALLAGLGQGDLPAPPEAGLACTLLPDGREALLLVTGIGPVNAAFGLGMAVVGHCLDGVVNLGVAGSFDLERLPLGTTCAVSAETWPEFGLHTPAGLDPQGLGLAQLTSRRERVVERLEMPPRQAAAAMGLDLPQAWPCVSSLTVAGVSGCPERAAEVLGLTACRTAPALENMEGFALALGARRAGLPFLEVRTVSNRVGSRPPEGWDLPLALEALGSAASTLLGAGRNG